MWKWPGFQIHSKPLMFLSSTSGASVPASAPGRSTAPSSGRACRSGWRPPAGPAPRPVASTSQRCDVPVSWFPNRNAQPIYSIYVLNILSLDELIIIFFHRWKLDIRGCRTRRMRTRTSWSSEDRTRITFTTFQTIMDRRRMESSVLCKKKQLVTKPQHSCTQRTKKPIFSDRVSWENKNKTCHIPWKN